MQTAGNAASLVSSGANIAAVATADKRLEFAASNLSTVERIINSISGIANNPLVRPFVADALSKHLGHEMQPQQPQQMQPVQNQPMQYAQPVEKKKELNSMQMTPEGIYDVIQGALKNIRAMAGNITIDQMIMFVEKNKPVITLSIEKTMQQQVAPPVPTENKMHMIQPDGSYKEIKDAQPNSEAVGGDGPAGIGKISDVKKHPDKQPKPFDIRSKQGTQRVQPIHPKG